MPKIVARQGSLIWLFGTFQQQSNSMSFTRNIKQRKHNYNDIRMHETKEGKIYIMQLQCGRERKQKDKTVLSQKHWSAVCQRST